MNTKNFKRTFRSFSRFTGSLSPYDLLGYVGLQKQRSTLDYILPAVGLVGVGIAVGVGIGMALAPKAGAELRTDVKEDLKQKVNELREKVSTASNTTAPAAIHAHS
jgi:hypothetical protein